jgi:CheY-like chemotaxis protein
MCAALLIGHRDGFEAVEVVRMNTRTACFCLMDVSMASEKDGIDATRQLRDAGERLPFVALTGSLSPSIEDECLTAGMDGFLTKPCTAADLRHLLHKYLVQ